ncbi:serine hydrolase [Hydrotalea flava]|uniref:serine hydrolase n=1 Tax=Hydrotalea flava TaxID=714549 RepID=UPI00142ED743|nr:serine hydrolase [Hydrotalea flava]
MMQNKLPVNFIETLMQQHPSQFSAILQNRQAYNIQIIYTQINRDKNNQPIFKEFHFNTSNNNYFYPASTVKMPIAFLALEKLNSLNIPEINANTTLITDSSAPQQSFVFTQPTAIDSRPTIANYIKQIFLVSDNDAFNRLYEFLGQNTILNQLKQKGYPNAIIRHRLQVSLTDEQNRQTNACAFYDTSGKQLWHQPAQYNDDPLPNLKVFLGKGYYSNGKLLNQPFNFSEKNRVYLQDLTHMLRSVIFPESVPPQNKFNLTTADRKFLLHWMSAYPHESNYPNYDTATYWDAYCKFLMYGSEKGALPQNIRIFNKVGDAYGFLTDVSYIIDTKNKVEFMLSATISCNTDGIYNDDQYDYNSIGYPFMKNIGQLIYQYELTRKRTYLPDLSEFIFDYQKQ